MESEQIIQKIRTPNDENQKLKDHLSASRELVASYSIGIGNRDVIIDKLRKDFKHELDIAIETPIMIYQCECGIVRGFKKYAGLDVCKCGRKKWTFIRGSCIDDIIQDNKNLRETIKKLESENKVLEDGVAVAAKNNVKAMKLVRDRGEEISKQRKVIEEITTIEGQGYELINGLRNAINHLEDELSARKGDLEVLMKVVEIVNDWREDHDVKYMHRIDSIVYNHENAPEQLEDEDDVLIDRIAKTLHEMFTLMVHGRQMNGSIPSGSTDIVMYNKLPDSSKEYLYDQAGKILKLVNQ